MQFTVLSRLVAHPCIRSLSSLRSCGDFLPVEGTTICCHLVPIPCSLEFLSDILWIRLALFQLCSLQVKAGKGTESRTGLSDTTIPFKW